MVEVKFPDGVRSVPSRPRYVKNRPIGRPESQVYVGDEPMPMPGWAFSEAIGGGWTAYRR
jgi:hypothetical protein